MDSRITFPLARNNGLVIEELGDELLVYDLDVKHAHCLTPAAARVWRECNGKARTDDIARALQMEPGDVTTAIAELERCELLVMPKAKVVKAGLTRRDLGLKVTKVAAAGAAVPLILSIASPAVAATVSQEQYCFTLAPTGTNNCSICNERTGANTLCCCCHQPSNPNVGSLKLCAADAKQCCCGGGGLNYGPAHHCTEPDTGGGVNQQNCTDVVC